MPRIAPRRKRLVDEVIELVVGLPARPIDEIGHDEHRRGYALTAQVRERVLIHIAISVIERDRRNRIIERCSAGQAIADVVERYEAETFTDRLDVPLEHFLADEHARVFNLRRRREIGDDTVVPENQRAPLLARLTCLLLEPPRTGDCGGEGNPDVPAPAVSLFGGHGRKSHDAPARAEYVRSRRRVGARGPRDAPEKRRGVRAGACRSSTRICTLLHPRAGRTRRPPRKSPFEYSSRARRGPRHVIGTPDRTRAGRNRSGAGTTSHTSRPQAHRSNTAQSTATRATAAGARSHRGEKRAAHRCEMPCPGCRSAPDENRRASQGRVAACRRQRCYRTAS